MAKHRAEGPINDVLINDLYIGLECVGQIIMTEGYEPVIVFDEQTVGRSVKKLFEKGLPLRAKDEYRVVDRRVVDTPVQTLPSEVDLAKYPEFFDRLVPVYSDLGNSVEFVVTKNHPTLF